MRAGAVVVVVVVVGAFMFSCGSGEGIEAPKTIGPNEDVGACPGGDTVLLAFNQQVDDGAFDALRPVITEVFVDDGGLRTTLSLVSSVLPQLQAAEMRTVLSTITSDDGKATLDAVKPHVLNVLEYINGTSAFIPGKHPEPINALHEVMVSCDAAEQLLNVRNVIALEVNRNPAGPADTSTSVWVSAEPGTGESSWLFAFVEAVDRAAQLPKMRELLERIEINDDPEGGDGEIKIGRAAFIVIAKLLAKNVAAPDFQFQPTREILEDVAIPQLDGDADAEAALSELLDLFALLVAADSTTFEGMQAFMGCVDRHDNEAAIPTMLFDYLNIEELPIEDLLGDLAAVSAGDRLEDLRTAAIAIMDVVVQFPDQLGDATKVMAAMLAPEIADTTLSTVLALKGKGVLTDLTDFIGLMLDCKQVPL
ncbi:MAG: hypothetical protein Q8O67_23525 [Deltaproteobacteria bacterium]|nr:hypothetical protein [Deltaproteobacteria bacterium]